MHINKLDYEHGRAELVLSGVELEKITSAMEAVYDKNNIFTSELYEHLNIVRNIVRYGKINYKVIGE